tara:strand:- start:705 stop:1220 length:516 start_codon:yes stop_codon:yes gene_type:complete
MNPPPVMKTGFNNLLGDNNDQKYNIIATICHFTENALKTATHYVEHSKRNAITKEDIKRGLIMEVFLFGKRGNEMEEIVKIKKDIEEHKNDEDADISDLIIDDNEIMPFANSNCSCALCVNMNNIYDKWNNFTPSTQIETIMQKHINDMDTENSWFSDSDESSDDSDSDTE